MENSQAIYKNILLFQHKPAKTSSFCDKALINWYSNSFLAVPWRTFGDRKNDFIFL